MERRFCLVLMLAILLLFPHSAKAWDAEERDLGRFFEGFRGAFVMLDPGNNKSILFNREQCEKRLSPCSTFKIPNSLIGLETGVIKDENHLVKWDGTRYPYEPWNRDHILRSAVSNSVVWYFQELASKVGEERMKKYVHELHYGNEDISGGLTKFWLGSSLKISAEEQVDFLCKLYRNELPFSQRSVDITRKIIILDETDERIFRGKTGSGTILQEDGKVKSSLGWFIGWVERKEPKGARVFAVNIEGGDGATGKKAAGNSRGCFERNGSALIGDTGSLWEEAFP